MLATKNRAWKYSVLFIPLLVLLVGCKPPGVRALLGGKQLLDQGKYEEAIEQFKIATAPGSLVATNADAWNYLGLAYHRAGQSTNAVAAYQKALLLNRELLEARFNLGCVWLDQNQPEAAKMEFTAYTLRRSAAPEGWLKLGAAQLRLREFTAAEKSFQEAEHVSAQNPEALNGLGLVQVQRGKAKEGAQYFSAALKKQADYRPALLNLATVLHQQLNDKPGALQKYREYLALQPKADDWEDVNAIAQSLTQQLAPPPPPPQPMPVQHTNLAVRIAPNTNATRQATSTVARVSATNKVEVPTPVVKAPTPPPLPKTSAVEVATITTPPPTNPVRHETVTTIAPTKPIVTEIESSNEPKPAALIAAALQPDKAPPPGANARYKYLSPGKPTAGNRHDAERSFWQGQQSQRANRSAEAVQAYRQAVETDPSYFEAYYNLGLVAFDARSYRLSLTAWESALAVKPDSTDARYNFALALKAANYPTDAANELEKLLAADPKEARAHLVLGNLYAEQLGKPSRARTHYLKVLELDPRHPQATNIRYWLVAHTP